MGSRPIRGRVFLAGALVVGALVVGAAACGADDDESDSGASVPSGSEGLPARIECTTYYRPLGDESTQGSAEQTLVLDVSGNARVSQSAEFEAMRIEFRLDASDVGESTAFTVAVSTPSGEALTSVLYQLGTVRLDAVEFAGGHGFTGLHYVDHQGAQLQFWCSAE